MADEFEKFYQAAYCDPTRRAEYERAWTAALATQQQPQGDTCKAEPKHPKRWFATVPFGGPIQCDTRDVCLLCEYLHHAQVLAAKEAELVKVHECNIGLANLIAHRQPPSVTEVRSEAYGEGWQAAHNPLPKCGHPSACYQDKNWPESEKNYDPVTKTSNPPIEYQCVMCEMLAQHHNWCLHDC